MSQTPTQTASNAPAAAAERATAAGAGGSAASVVALGAAALVLLLEAAVALGAGSSGGTRAVWWLLVVGVVSATVARAALDDGERRVWLPATVALAAWFGGSLYYDDIDALGSPSAFRAADVVLLSFGLPAALAVGRLVRSRVEGFRPTIALDGLIVALAAGAAAAALLASVSTGLAPEGHPTLLTLAYPAAAFGFLSFSVWIIALGGRRPNRFWLVLTAGLALLTAGGS